ncbi:MAG: TMEM165/GDT1 family protein [Bacillota bacterium]|nr:TMEM165/GDT1 family protein [Bacillota bacterium]
MKAFLQSLSLIFAAEVGDKSQLLVLAMATKYPIVPLISGIISSIIVSQLIATSIGFLLGEAIPLNLINFLAGLLFIVIGIKTLLMQDDCLENDADSTCPANPFWKVFTLYTLGEFGDKTQITCIILASQNGSFIGTFLGAVLAMILANIISLGLGRFVSTQLSTKTIRIIAAVMYISFGIFSLLELIRH